MAHNPICAPLPLIGTSQTEMHQELSLPPGEDSLGPNKPQPSLSQFWSCLPAPGLLLCSTGLQKNMRSGVLASRGWTFSLETEVCGGGVWGEGPGL